VDFVSGFFASEIEVQAALLRFERLVGRQERWRSSMPAATMVKWMVTNWAGNYYNAIPSTLSGNGTTWV